MRLASFAAVGVVGLALSTLAGCSTPRDEPDRAAAGRGVARAKSALAEGEVCPDGQEPDGADGCQECAAGTASAGGAACAACPAGTSADPGSAACVACPAGTFADVDGSAACSACPAGAFAGVEGSASCAACEAGSYADIEGSAACSACPAGTFADAGSGACTPCAQGQFTDVEGSAACAACGDGLSTAGPGSTSAECVACAPGEISNADTGFLCVPDGGGGPGPDPGGGGDCGGPGAVDDPALRCADGVVCAAATDCKSGVCSAATGVCVAGTSCGLAPGDSTAGVDTCGAGETGSGGETHESCCKSLPLPLDPTRRLDKYEVTAGRVRRFIAGVTATYGAADIRQFAYDFGAANPDSQLGYLTANYPTVVDILPASSALSAKPPLAVHLGVYPLDPMNALDGCWVGSGSYGHPTYWQDPATLRAFGIDNGGNRRFSQADLDEKPMNCAMSLLFMAFCAWDGGELAAMTDYQQVWGNNPQLVGATNVYVPWATVLGPGEFNWRNGQNGTFDCPIAGWPGCVPKDTWPPQPIHYQYPAGVPSENDASGLISAPGRFPADVTAATSASGEGWMDIGGASLETGWVPSPPDAPSGAIADICDVSASPAAGESPCVRQGANGVLRHAGPLPHLPLVGYSWEGHARYNEAYLAGNTATPSSWKPVTFQYGKSGGRCARLAR
jgi:hypothetical protein